MSKNLTRKGLAIGAVLALGTTLFAGAPAFAGVDDGSVTIKPTTGTSYNALLNTDFSLDVNYVSGIAVNGAKLSALIEDSTSQVKAAFSQTSTSPTTKTFTSGSVVVESASTPDSAGAATADVLRLALPSTVTATTAVGVTVWYDSNADKVIDTNEKVAAKKTVTFYKSSEITWTSVLNAPTIGDTSLTGTITPSIVLNGQQIGDDANVIGDFGSSITNSSINTSTQSDYNSDNKNWAFTSGTITGAAAGVTYSVQPYIIDGTVGTRIYTSVATVTAAAASGSLVASTDVAPDGKVRVGATTATFNLSVTKANGDAVAAGVPVKFSWSGSVTGYNSTTAPITLNGTAKASGAVLTVLTDAKGVASVTVKVPATNVAGETVTLAWDAVEGVSGTDGTKVLTFTAPDLTVVDTGIDGELYTGSTAYGDVYQAVSGSSKTLSLKVVDQWKVATTATDLEIKSVTTGRTVGTTYTKVVSGAANVVIADGAVGSGTTTVAVLTLVKNTSGSYTALTASTTPKSTVNTNSLDTDGVLINYVAASGSGKVTLGGTKANVAEDLAGTVHADEIAAANTDVQNASAPVDTPTSQVVGVITNATTGALLAGTEVTISGSGLLFNVGNQYGVGTLTFRANASAEFAVNVYANKATTGTVVTVASNGASATKTVVFTSSLTPKSLTITAPAYAQAGTAVDVIATVADKWGNGVSADSLTISSSGPGYLNATGSTTTLTSGVVRAKLILGASETGSVVITATTTNTNGTFATAANRTVTAAMTVGLAAAAPATTAATAAVSGSKGKFYVSATNAAAKKVVVKVAGKFAASFTGTAAKKSVAVKATKGSKKVTVFVGGKLVATKTVTVK